MLWRHVGNHEMFGEFEVSITGDNAKKFNEPEKKTDWGRYV